MIDLIFINLYGTILNDNLFPRDGVIKFFNRYKSKRIAIISYKSKDITMTDLKLLGLLDKVEKIYTEESMAHVRVYNKTRNDLQDYYPQPLLKAWTQVDFNTILENIVVISNNPWDKIATDWYNVKLIEIPNKGTFSFDKISIDSFYNNIIYLKQRLQLRQQIITYK